MMTVEHAVYVVAAVVFVGLCAVTYFYERGQRWGACVEMCRPAKFDDAQEVNGGCLCIGSDKVLRIRKAP
jgi:hypothetical protein